MGVSQKAIGLELTRALFSTKINTISNIKVKCKGEKNRIIFKDIFTS